MKFDKWRLPEKIDALPNIKYIRGQLEYSEKNYLHWQFAIEYFQPTKFICVMHEFPTAHIEPIFSISAWNYVWKEKTGLVGSQFEFGDASDVLKEMKLRNINTFVKRDESLSTNLEQNLTNELISRTTSYDIDSLEKKLIDISKYLYFLPQSALTVLYKAVDEAEMIDLQNSIEDYDVLLPLSLNPTKTCSSANTANHNRRNAGMEELDIPDLTKTVTLDGIENYDALLPVTPASSGAPNSGKPWRNDDITELDRMLKDNFTIKEIAEHFGRSKRSIVLKGASVIHEKLKSGYNFEKAILIYKNKISYKDILKFQELKERDPWRFKKMKTGHQSISNTDTRESRP